VSVAELIAAAALVLATGLFSFVQLLYLEALRLRARELPALEYFKDTLEDRLGMKTERGALSFSLIKHSLLVGLGLVSWGAVARDGAAVLAGYAEAAALGLGLMLAGAYLGPHFLYRRTDGRWLAPLAGPLRLAALLVRPLVLFFEFLQSLATLGGRGETHEESGGSAEDDLEALIEAGADEGLIEEDDRRLIQSVVALGDKTVREVMTPRPGIVAIRDDATVEELRKLTVESRYSRVPVYHESIDDVIGFVHVRDLVEMDYEERKQRRVREIVRPVRVVPETNPAQELMREMQKEQAHMAVVVDEYGQTAGIVTMEDVVEEVFGEIHDEHDELPDGEVRQEAEGVYLLAGSVDVDRLDELFGFRPDEETESTTVGGLVTEWLGRVPRVGESAERSGLRLEVTAGDERHVAKVRASRIAAGRDTEERDGE
jgi:CBS domain containing-hemolysin-like protein